jgi:hypothetical protein
MRRRATNAFKAPIGTYESFFLQSRVFPGSRYTGLFHIRSLPQISARLHGAELLRSQLAKMPFMQFSHHLLHPPAGTLAGRYN